MLDHTPPQEAIEAPRLNAVPGAVRLEPGFSRAVLQGLEADGDEVTLAEGPDPYFGGVSGLSWLGAGADPRRSGHAEIYRAGEDGAPGPHWTHPES
jgi:gamma-glutamyltranspeptidase/glutathione hydrolase